MGLEVATYISGLNASNPIHATDQVSQGDDHLRLLKSTIKASFPGITGPVLSTQVELNYLDGATGVTGTGQTVRHTAPTFSGLVTAGSFAGSIAAANIDSGILPDARIQASGVTQWQASLSITESQISDFGTYLSDNDQITTLEVGNATDTTLSRKAAGTLAVEGDAVFSHDAGSYTSAKIHFSNGTEPTTEGADGDIFLVY